MTVLKGARLGTMIDGGRSSIRELSDHEISGVAGGEDPGRCPPGFAFDSEQGVCIKLPMGG